jgi:hypothetical protein
VDDRLTALDRTLRLLAEYVVGSPEQIAAELGRTIIVLRAGRPTAHSGAGQAALATLVNLLTRTGVQVRLDLPALASASALLPAGLPDGLVSLSNAVFPGSVDVTGAAPADLAIAIGDVDPPAAERTLWLRADKFRIGFSDRRGDFSPPEAVAALESASMAAAECIRFALRGLEPRSRTAAAWLAPIREALLPSRRLPGGPIDLGDVDVVSGGAITNGVLWTFAARGDIQGRLRLFDDGHYEITNVNRYMWLDRRRALAGEAKVEHLAALAITGLEIEGVERRFRPADRANARKRILVGADDIAVRHIAQDSDPDWLGVGATSHDEARVTEHKRGEPCARCAHPTLNGPDNTPIPTIAPVSFAAGLHLAVAVLAYAAGQPTPLAERYATYWPLRPGAQVVGPVSIDARCPTHGRPWPAA